MSRDAVVSSRRTPVSPRNLKRRLAFSVPALIAGVAATTFGLHSTALAYSASLAALAALAVGILVSRPPGRRPAGATSEDPGEARLRSG
jgi:hypothetical protein